MSAQSQAGEDVEVVGCRRQLHCLLHTQCYGRQLQMPCSVRSPSQNDHVRLCSRHVRLITSENQRYSCGCRPWDEEMVRPSNSTSLHGLPLAKMVLPPAQQHTSCNYRPADHRTGIFVGRSTCVWLSITQIAAHSPMPLYTKEGQCDESKTPAWPWRTLHTGLQSTYRSWLSRVVKPAQGYGQQRLAGLSDVCSRFPQVNSAVLC